MTAKSKASASVTRREAKASTRARLLDAALEILDDEGEAGLTTTAVTRRAGVAQPTFYGHFADVDDLLGALIEEVAEKRRTETRRARSDARHGATGALRETFRIPLEDMLAHPKLFRLLVKSRFERSPLGDWSRSVLQASRTALVEDLTNAGMPARSASDRRKVRMVADGVIALTETLALGRLDGRYPDTDEVIDILIAFSRGYFPLLRPS